MTTASSNLVQLPIAVDRVKPTQIAHFVIYTSRFSEATAWYKTLLDASSTFENDTLAFLTYDDEHHRVAIASLPGLAEQPKDTAAIHHIAFSYSSLWELLFTWQRLTGAGIHPYWTVNHGPTTSLYYADPDGNRIELQVDNFTTADEAKAYCAQSEFLENSVGVEFEPEDLIRRLNAGESEASLKRRPNIGPRCNSTSKA